MLCLPLRKNIFNKANIKFLFYFMNVNELKNAIQKYGETLHSLRNENQKDAMSKMKCEKMNDEIDNLEDKINQIRQRPMVSNSNLGEEQKNKFQTQYKNAFLNYLRKGVDSDLIALLNTNSSNINIKGYENLLNFDSTGFAITPNMNAIISTNMFNNSPIRKLARVINVTRDSLDVAAYTTDISAVWGDERTVAPETDAFSRKTIKVNELTAQPKITQKMIDDDAVDHESWIADLLSDILLAKEDNAFLHGDGVNKPVGILSYPDGRGNDEIERVNGGNEITFENLLQLQASLDGRYEKNGEVAFITSKKNLAKIRSIKDEAGQYIWTPGVLLNNQDCIFGTPIYSTSELQDGTDAVIYGNLRKGYQIVDRSDIKIQRDPYSSKPFVVFFATKRVGGDVIDTKAIKVLKINQ